MDHSRIFKVWTIKKITFWTIQQCPFQNHLRNFIFWTIPQISYSFAHITSLQKPVTVCSIKRQYGLQCRQDGVLRLCFHLKKITKSGALLLLIHQEVGTNFARVCIVWGRCYTNIFICFKEVRNTIITIYYNLFPFNGWCEEIQKDVTPWRATQ